MKEARVQVKVPLVPRPLVKEPEEVAGFGVEKDKLASTNIRTVPDEPITTSSRGATSKQESAQNTAARIHIPVIELDQFRRVKRRRMRTFGRGRRWGKNNARWQPAAAVSAVLALALLIPAILVWPRTDDPVKPIPVPPGTGSVTTPAPSPAVPVTYPEPQVRVYLSATGTTMNLPLEDYVTGVVAAEMPAEFRLEALKAQAIAARTFIVRRLAANDTSGVPSGEADVTDTVSHQVFIPPEKVKADWTRLGKAKEWEKLQQAVRESKDSVMTYQGKAITASFFSTSNGYTENAEDVWGNPVPYLQSVASPWDKKLAPGFEETITMKRSEILQKLNLGANAIPVSAQQSGGWMEVLSTTQGHRIKEIQIAGKTFSGPEVRKLLGLRSSQFSWKTDGNEVEITTYGYGHGVGMSQWGANGMAQEGHTATQILKHYYTGISFGQASKMLASK
ncbi:stage II sporulation protein D [Paenibacillus taichungensis]|uniref:Stage II sporulation protein D n=1 Tax=Paenibacillus taichungensis TaxID=484184 RepID=A0A329QTK7_9BACL|nr:stage II sporulation protein D [Paenibacillus taichungensis]RAW15754.1 stage II sporulation protein D [Paenibacillus taichungensis]